MRLLLCIAVMGMGPAAASAGDWGTIRGQFVLEGEVPVLKPLVRKGETDVRDSAICSAEDIPDERIVVDVETRGIANIAIWLRETPSQVHPDLERDREPDVKIEIKGCRFPNRMTAVRTDQQVRCVVGDDVAHNVRVSTFRNPEVGYTVPASRTEQVFALTLTEPVPVVVSCDFHAHMRSYWIVTDHPYVAITDSEGRFKIEKLPAGRQTFAVWHERVGWVEKEFEVDVAPGDTELPTQTIAVERFRMKS